MVVKKLKSALAKIIVSDYNVLFLGCLTNYLDIYSMEAVEDAFSKYEERLSLFLMTEGL